MIVPGSHKSNFPHPNAGDYGKLDRMDHLEGAVELYLKKGDALLFVEGVMHGGGSRTNPGQRRMTIFRYGASWGSTRYGYHYSQELLDRLRAGGFRCRVLTRRTASTRRYSDGASSR